MNTHNAANAGSGRATIRTVIVQISRKLKATYRIRSGRRFSDLLLALVAVIAAPVAHALPSGLTVQAGQTTVSTPTANSMVLNQGTNKAILDWQSYSIGAGQSVQYVQPGASSVSLNRVTGGDLSSIYGSLTANGQVFLVNPAGVLFAPGAMVNVGGLVASTLSLSNNDFLAGRYNFSGNGGNVTNQGTITGGYVALAGNTVNNAGAISTPGGAVGLLAGSRVTVDASGAGLVKFSVDGGAVGAAITNSGTIIADGGNVALSAQAIGDTLATVINQSGVIRANTLENHNGTIVLSGGNTGVVSVGGSLEAKGANAGETGGTVKVLGDKVGLFAGARVDASGDAGGGTVLVGGNLQGNGNEHNAFRTYVDRNASINADAVTRGDGGKVIVWSDDLTRYSGSISAKGGAGGGNGGFAEVSGKRLLKFDGQVDLTAAKGAVGTLLLDPLNITIITGGGDDLVGTTGDDGLSNVYAFGEDAGASASIDPGFLNGLGASVTLQATNNITIANAVNLTTAGAGLTAQAGNNILVNATIDTNNGGITLSANDPASGGASGSGAVSVNAAINAGTAGVTLTNNGSSGTHGISANISGGSLAISGPISLGNAVAFNTGGGTISMSRLTGNAHSLSLTAGGGVSAGWMSGVNLLTTANGTNLTASSLTVGSASLGGDVITSGSQTYTGNVVLTNDVVAGGSSLAFGTVEGTTPGNEALITTGGPAAFGGSVGAVTPLQFFSLSQGGILNGNVSTTGYQTYGGLKLGASVTLTSTTSKIEFANTVDGTTGAENLIVNAPGFTRFNDPAGAGVQLGSITTDAAGTLEIFSLVRTSGAQTFNENMTLIGNATLQSTGGGAIHTANIAGGANSLTITSAGNVTTGAISANNVTLTAGAMLANSATSATVTGNYSVTADDFSGSLSPTLNGANSSYTIVDRAGGLTIGAFSAPGTLSITTQGGGNLNIAGASSTTGNVNLAAQGGGTVTLGGNVTATAGNVDIDGPLSLSNTVALSANGGAGTINVDAVTGNGNSLSLTGDTTAATVSGVNALTTAAGTDISAAGVSASSASLGGNVATSGAGGQTYGATVLNANVTLDATGGGALAAGADVSTGAVTGNGNNLTINAGTGGVVSTAAISGVNGYQVTNSGFSNLNGSFGSASITSQGAVNIDGTTAVTGTLTINAGGAVTQTAASLAANALTINSGGTVALTSVANDVNTLGPVTSSGGFTYNDLNGLTLAGSVADAAGAVNITAAGALALGANNVSGIGVSLVGSGVTQAAGSAINGGSGTVAVDGNDGALTLAGSITTSNAGAAAVQIVNATTVALGNISTGAGGTVTIGGAGGNNLSGAVTQTGVINAGTVTVNGGSTVALGNGNTVSNLGPVTTGGNFSFNDASGGLTLTGAVSAGGGAVSIATSGGALALGANGVSGAGVTLAGTGVTQSAGSTVDAGSGDILVDANDGAINLAGGLTTSSNTASAVRIIDSTTAALGNIATGATGSVTLGAAAVGDNLAGAVTQNGATTINTGTLVVNGGGTVNLSNGNAITNLGAVTTNGNFAFTNAAVLNVTAAVDSGTGQVAIQTTAGALNVAAAGDITAGDTVTLTGAGGINTAGDVTTSDDAVSYVGAVTLTGPVAVNAGSATAAFSSTVAGGGNPFALTATGGASAGAVSGLGDLTLSNGTNLAATSVAVAGAATLGGNVTTTGATGQSYGSTTLTADVALDAGAANPITLGAVTGGGNDLTLTGAATTTGVTGVDALVANQSLVTTGALSATSVAVTGAASLGGNVTTTGAAGQSYGSTALAADVALDAGAANPITLGAITGNGNDLTLTGLASTSGASGLDVLTANQSLTTTGALSATSVVVAGAASLGGDVTTTGAAGQSYGSTALTADVTLDAGAANPITLNAVTGGGNDLMLTGAATTTGISGVDVLAANQSLTTTGAVSATSVAVTGAASLGGNVTTTGAAGQSYGSTTLTTDVALDAGAANPITLNAVTGGGNDLTLAGAATTTGVTGVDVLVANQSLTATGAISATSVAVAGAASLGGNVTTTGVAGQSYGSTTLNADITLDAGAANPITLGTITGNANDLTLTGLASTSGGSGIDVLTANQSLTTTGALSATSVAVSGAASLGGNVTTTGAAGQSYGSTTLTADVALDAGAANPITLNAVTGGGNDLTLTGTATTTGVTGVDALVANQTLVTTGAVSATSVAVAGAASLGGNVTTTGAAGQSYGSTMLTTDVALDAGAANPITLNAVTGGGNDLTLTGAAMTTGVTGVDVLVANQSLTTTGAVSATSVAVAGAASLGGNVTTTGAAGQSYGATTLTTDVALDAGATNPVTLGAITGNGNDLTLTGVASTTGGSGPDVLTANQSLTTTGALAANSVSVAGAASLGGDVTTTGTQAYAGSVTLSNDVALQSTGNGAITMASLAGGNNDLALNTTGGVTSNGAVTGVDKLTLGSDTDLAASSVSTNAADLAGNVSTSAGQTYGGAVTLNGGVTLADSGSGNVTFNGTIDGGQALTVTTGGTTAFMGTVGGTTALASLATNGGGTTDINASVTTTGAQTYADNVVLSTDVALAGSGIAFQGTVAGAGHDLTLQTPGTASFTSASGIDDLNFGGGSLDSTGTLTANRYNMQGGTVNALLGAGTLNVQGNTALNGTSAASAVNVTGGTLTLGSGANRLINATTVAIDSGATLDTGSASQQLGATSALAAVTNNGTLVVPVGLTAASVSSPGVLQTGANAVLNAQGAISAANDANTIGENTSFNLGGTLNVTGDFAGAVQVDGFPGGARSTDVTLTDTSASTLTVAKMQVAPTASVTLVSPQRLVVNTPQLSPVRLLTVNAPNIMFEDSDLAITDGSPGVIATEKIDVTITPEGSLNTPDDPMYIHPRTPSIVINGVNPVAKNYWIAGNVGTDVVTARVLGFSVSAVSAIYAETARFLRTQQRADAGLLGLENLVMFANLPLDAVVAPLSFPSLLIREPRCLDAQRKGEPGCQ